MWLEYFSQYMETVFPRFLSERPWNYKNDLCVTGAAFQADAVSYTHLTLPTKLEV